MFKKVIGDVNFHQVSLFFSVIGILNSILLWPIVLTLYFTGAGKWKVKKYLIEIIFSRDIQLELSTLDRDVWSCSFITR